MAAKQVHDYRRVRGNWEGFGRFLLQGFPGVGPTLASSILERFGKAPLSWSCTLDELKSVPGMGENRARALWKLLE